MDEEEDEEENEASYRFNQEEHKIDDIEKLRDERLDLYEDKEKITTFINDLDNQRKKLDAAQSRIKSELERTEEEIQDFQKEKMAKLNQLVVSIVLKAMKVQNLEEDPEAVANW